MKRLFTAACAVMLVGLLVAAAAAADKEKKKKKERPKLPAAAKGFAGMIQGKVVAVKKAGLTLKVEKVGQVWKHSKAKDPQSLVGLEVRVGCRKENGKPSERHLRFLKTLKPGDATELDVANKKGDSLTLLELTAEQRKKIEEK